MAGSEPSRSSAISLIKILSNTPAKLLRKFLHVAILPIYEVRFKSETHQIPPNVPNIKKYRNLANISTTTTKNRYGIYKQS